MSLPTAAPAPDEAVAVRDLAVSLAGRRVLDGVSLTVGRGEFTAVLGPNGAGKSTLMRALLGLLAPERGTITVLGESPARARSRIGYLPQRHRLEAAAGIRGVDLVRLGLDGMRWGLPVALTPASRQRRAEEQGRVWRALEQTGAESYAHRPLGSLSGGEQQRVLIAQALVARPRLLILDEPLDGLDLPTQSAFSALIRRICSDEGITTLLVAHDVNPLLPHLDRVVYLAAGRALAGTVDQVITTPSLTRLLGAPIEVLRARDGRLVVLGEPEAPHHHGHRHAHP